MSKNDQKSSAIIKKPARKDRERLILIALVDLYLKTGKPVGSQTLKEEGFGSMSSATIRNYFVKLEQEGFLEQSHASGGRVPTAKAYRAYATSPAAPLSRSDLGRLKKALGKETRETHSYLERAGELLSEMSGCALFLSMPRFDQDFVVDVKFVSIDARRCLAVIVTEFGVVHTELLHTEKKISRHSLTRIEAYFHFRMTGKDEPKMSKDEMEVALHFYQEVMVRHIIGHASFSHADLYKTGVSKLIKYPEFGSQEALSSGLSLFENEAAMEKLLDGCSGLKFWIGEDGLKDSAVIAMPYFVKQRRVGAIALFGPMRLPYPVLFALLREASQIISETLTSSLYKFKITFRQVGENLLLEDQRTE